MNPGQHDLHMIKDLTIIEQLLYGYHLTNNELKRAKELLHKLETEIDKYETQAN